MMVFELCTVEELFGEHGLQSKTTKDYKLVFGENRIEINSVGSALSYKRYVGADLAAEAMIVSNEDAVMIGVFPIPPLFTPTAIAKNVFLKFKTPVLVDQMSQAVVYAKMPVEIGIYRQSKDEEILLDSFSRKRQQYALYGSPESGVVCRYTETEVSMNNDDIKLTKYEEALVRIRIKNDIDNIVKVSKVIIPMDGVVLDHAHDDAWLPGNVEMDLSTSFGKDMVHVRLMNTKVKRSDKTSTKARKEETLVFLMDAGY
ncbi:MAG TPA: DUF432 domain-containing protein [Nitrososphaera sp.]|jgi:hypothetical protein|nr:DUF432 domain-containing protein [Nitrososphaera sp.]